MTTTTIISVQTSALSSAVLRDWNQNEWLMTAIHDDPLLTWDTTHLEFSKDSVHTLSATTTLKSSRRDYTVATPPYFIADKNPQTITLKSSGRLYTQVAYTVSVTTPPYNLTADKSTDNTTSALYAEHNDRIPVFIFPRIHQIKAIGERGGSGAAKIMRRPTPNATSSLHQS